MLFVFFNILYQNLIVCEARLFLNLETFVCRGVFAFSFGDCFILYACDMFEFITYLTGSGLGRQTKILSKKTLKMLVNKFNFIIFVVSNNN